MKKPRWRKIIKVSKRHASFLMNKYYWHEHASIAWYTGTLSLKEELAILGTIHDYANRIERTSKIDMYEHPEEWVQELTNFTD